MGIKYNVFLPDKGLNRMSLLLKRRSAIRRVNSLRSILYRINLWDNNEELKLKVIRRACSIAVRYKKKPRSMLHLALASLIIASRELGITLDIKELLEGVKKLGESVELSSILRIVHDIGEERKLKGYHSDQTKRIIMKIILSTRGINDRERLSLIRESLKESMQPYLTGLRPASRALLAFLVSIKRMNLDIDLDVHKLSEITGLSEVTIYKAIKKAEIISRGR